MTIKIFNTLGEEIATLVDHHMLAGNYQIQWNINDFHGHELSSGVYFCRMQAGSFTEVQKMTLMR